MRGFPTVYPDGGEADVLAHRYGVPARWHNVYVASDGTISYGAGHASRQRAERVGDHGSPRPAYRLKITLKPTRSQP